MRSACGSPSGVRSDASVTAVRSAVLHVDGDGAQDHAQARPRQNGIDHRRPPHAVTLGAAYLSRAADFPMLDRNPLDVASPDELRDIKVLGTVMGRKAFPAGAIGENDRPGGKVRSSRSAQEGLDEPRRVLQTSRFEVFGRLAETGRVAAQCDDVGFGAVQQRAIAFATENAEVASEIAPPKDVKDVLTLQSQYAQTQLSVVRVFRPRSSAG